MIRVLYGCLLTLIVTTCLSLFSVRAEENNMMQPQHLLVLHSYDPSYPWTADVQRGIEDALARYPQHFRLSLEYLDAKRVFNASYLASMRTYLAEKYVSYSFDAIIVTDDNALTFLNSLNLDNFSQRPTVALGIGDLDATLIPTTSKGVILHTESHLKENIDLIVRLRPDIDNLYYLSDRSLSSRYMRDEMLRVLRDYPQIHLVEIQDMTLKDTRQFLQKAPEQDAVLLGHFNTELGNNIYYEYANVAQAIGGYSQPPVFVLWEFYITNGVLGGYVTRSYDLGVKAVDIIVNQLNGVQRDRASYALDTLTAMFDYQALKAHRISFSSLPENALVIGKPENFWMKHIQVVIYSGGIIFILLVVIVVQVLLLRRKQQIDRQNSEIVALQNKTLKVQGHLIDTLSEAIEIRSGETGNHVKRVATISARLAKLKSLPKEQCDLIEMISPMHDIGKISIPESILEKPGKLTDEEWSIMQTHASQGYKILNSDDGEILNQAAIIALEHHEWWNGQGYPDGKAGLDIHIFARITAVADVFDALLSNRCYKRAWSLNEVIQFFTEQRGKQFDPELADILLNNMEQFIAIWEQYPDC